jgi:endonuclease/exonuclease/phosphatase (EEP) superfamily protein YafD
VATTGKARVVRALAIAYVIALVLIALSMRYVGERWSVTTLLIYLPRLGWIVPLPVVVLLLFAVNERRLGYLLTLFVPIFVVFPLMGLKLGGSSNGTQAVRLMTWNTFYGRNDNGAILEAVNIEQPDVFLSQATGHRTKELFREQARGYTLDTDDEFFIATKFPIVEKHVPPHLAEDPDHPAAWVRYTLKTPQGLVDVFSIHPRSPREGVEEARGNGFRSRLTNLGLLGSSAHAVAQNTLLRTRQLETLDAALRTAKNPILVAGDTNLPTSSWLFHHVFDDLALSDAFDRVGAGFGYTFPAKVPWMRIDRVLASHDFTFLRIHDGGGLSSDHRYVVVDLAR